MNRRDRRRGAKEGAAPPQTPLAAERAFAAAVEDFKAGAWAAAERRLVGLLESLPDHPEVLYLLGLAVLESGRAGEAVPYLERAAAGPRRADALNALGSAYRREGRLPAAVAALEKAIAFRPGFADALYNLGNAHADAGRFADAVDRYRAAVANDPALVDAHCGRGRALRALGRLDEAIAAFKEAIRLKPKDADARLGLGNAHLDRSETGPARRAFEAAVALAPGNAPARGNLGNALTLMGRVEEGHACFEKALALDPGNAALRSNFIFHCCYNPGYDAAALLAEARRWNDRHARPLAARRRPHDNDRDPDRRLRLGYVSPDFRRHPLGWFMAPVLPAHDRTAVEVFCYSANAYADDLTARLKAGADRWREVAGLGDGDLADQIRRDRIDVLVDLAGHTGRNRLLAFAEKPAPVQATAMIPGTSGVETIDWIVADRYEIPPGAEGFYSEKVARLPDGFHCYAPPEDAPAVSPPPAGRAGAVTFGCFNNVAKVGPEVMALWARVLRGAPESRLLLKTKALDDPDVRDWYLALAARHGIAADRLVLAGGAPHLELLAAYGEVDIALDPFPYSGGLTTLEALWMGVPVITLAGRTFAGRHSTSHLSNLGLPELIAATAEDYAGIAARLAADRDGRAALRRGLRDRMAASPLCDGRRYTRDLEAAFRAMWRAWCANGG
jgi:predicted O-linked N-acetylglucosamine transferase (SPINDLY family)